MGSKKPRPATVTSETALMPPGNRTRVDGNTKAVGDGHTGAAAEVNIGERLRAIRNLRRYTLRHVAEQAGLSESFLSQVERAQASVSIASLQRIAAALGVTISDLFEPDGQRKPRVLELEARPTLAFGKLGRKFLLTLRPLDNLEVFLCQFEPGGSTGDEPYTHGDSEELLLVTAGQIHLQLGTNVHVMKTGDAIDYRSSVPHRIVNMGSELAETLFIISPPSF